MYHHLRSFMENNSIQHAFTTPYSPQQNGSSKENGKTPYKLWMGRKPSYKYVQRVDCIFIGYAPKRSAYLFLLYESRIPDIHKNTIMESRNASLSEHMFSCLNKEDTSTSRMTHQKGNEEEEQEETEPRRSKRTSKFSRSNHLFRWTLMERSHQEQDEFDLTKTYMETSGLITPKLYMIWRPWNGKVRNKARNVKNAQVQYSSCLAIAKFTIWRRQIRQR
ncbi:hypothetical protein OSB04_020191 [Centaurea solstitialis]|uniref:Integrase catalytic domain-containing protein n=1 Tax=Centaurea solstitialis TaxID=347529 RepID=A0AA38SS81_9ASTR|nr:hypothetical protein OSB04_020191 [Centaurea solstitialis]